MNGVMFYTRRVFSFSVFFLILLTVLACGGGGGGNDSTTQNTDISYSGLTTPATLTGDNAQKIFATMWGGGSSSGVSSAQTMNSSQASSGYFKNSGLLALLARSGSRSLAEYKALAAETRKANFNSAAPVQQTRQGSVSGTLTISGNLDSDTLTGSLNMNYVNYNNGNGVTYNGKSTWTIDSYDLANDVVTDGTQHYTSMNIVTAGSNLSLTGSLRDQVSIQSNTEIRTCNVDGRDNITRETFRFENFMVMDVYDNILNPALIAEIFAGRMYAEKYGYVDISQTAALIYSTFSQQNPDSGGPIIFSGASNSRVAVSPYSGSYVVIYLDANGDGSYEFRHTYSWGNLTGSPIFLAPIANAGSDQTVNMNTSVTLDGTASVDLNGNALTYAWTLTSKPNGSSAALSSSTASKPTFTADVAGVYIASLVVNNGTLSSSPATVKITALFVADPSPLPPLGQAVAYQIDYAHSGRAVFANSLSFPGAPTWSVTLNGAISYPLIAGGLVFVTTNSSGQGGYGTSLYALDEKTGNIVWGPKYISGTYYWSGHAYDHGKIFVVNFDGLLRSFNAATGVAGWSTQLPGQYAFSSSPTAVNGIVYVGGAGSGGTLYAVDESTGNVLWTAGVANGDKSSPAVSSDGVFVTYPCQAYKFSPLTGASLWHYEGGCSGGGGRTAAYANGLLYVRDFTSNPSGIIFDAVSGAATGNFTATPIPAFTTQAGFFLSSGTLTGVNLSTSGILWSFVGDGLLVSAPIIVNSTVVIGSSTGNVYAIDAASGSQIWTGNAGSAIAAPDEQNVSQPLTGLGAGDGYLIVPAGSVLTAWKISTP